MQGKMFMYPFQFYSTITQQVKCTALQIRVIFRGKLHTRRHFDCFGYCNVNSTEIPQFFISLNSRGNDRYFPLTTRKLPRKMTRVTQFLSHHLVVTCSSPLVFIPVHVNCRTYGRNAKRGKTEDDSARGNTGVRESKKRRERDVYSRACRCLGNAASRIHEHRPLSLSAIFDTAKNVLPLSRDVRAKCLYLSRTRERERRERARRTSSAHFSPSPEIKLSSPPDLAVLPPTDLRLSVAIR